MLLFNLAGFASLYALQRLQGVLPLNPQGMTACRRTRVQHRGQLHHQHELAELRRRDDDELSHADGSGSTVQNFVSAAAGIAIAVALIRGFAGGPRRRSAISGSTSPAPRSTSCCRLSIVARRWFSSPRACPRTWAPTSTPRPCEGAQADHRPGPVASQIAIKQLGTNGGGFFNANSAHPFENPTPLTNFLEMLLDLRSSPRRSPTRSEMVGDTRQGWACSAAMGVLFLCRRARLRIGPSRRQPAFASSASTSACSAIQAGGNMEGKEVRFGIVNSALLGHGDHRASNGAVNCDARHLHAARRAGADGHHPARRGDLRRRRLGLYGMLCSPSSPCSSPG